MKNIVKSFTVLILVLISYQVKAQTNEINFTLSSANINFSGENIAVSSTIQKAGSTLNWNQQANDGIVTTSYTITSISENWNQQTSVGTITYNMTIDEMPCQLILLGESPGLIATLIVDAYTAEQEKYIFNIDTITYQ